MNTPSTDAQSYRVKADAGRADVAVLIVSFNSAEWLLPCLASVYNHAGDVVPDVVVVDNGSTDGSPELVEARYPQVRVLRSDNRGFAYGNNRGLEIVDAEFVLFLNPDAELRDGTLAELALWLEDRPRAGLVGCRQLDTDGTLFPTIRRFPSPIRHLLEALGSERFPIRASWLGERVLDPRAYEQERSCDWVSGSFMFARVDAVLAVGSLDERFFLYAEETDLCARLRAAGWDVLYTPDMTVVHQFTKDGHSDRLESQLAYARRQYMYKHDGPIRRRFGILALALYYARRATTPFGNDPGRRARRRAARAALRTLIGVSPPPFGAPSSDVRSTGQLPD